MVVTLKSKVQSFLEILDKFPEVKYMGDSILRQATREVSISEGIEIGKKLGDILMRYRKEAGYGRGFAAPQIGENKSVFVTFLDDKIQIFINPKIIEKSVKTNFYRELCLSSGIIAADVERAESIVLEWINENGKKRTEKFDGVLARLYQHEEAHLQGKLNIDESAAGGIEFMILDPLKETLRDKR